MARNQKSRSTSRSRSKNLLGGLSDSILRGASLLCMNCGGQHLTKECKKEMLAELRGPLKDGGDREKYATGMVREPNGGRGRFELISPIALKKLAIHYENGCIKYPDRNWEKGGKLSRHFCSAMRHLTDLLEGDRTEDHISAAAWHCFAMQHVVEMIKRGKLPAELNDLPNYMAERINDESGSRNSSSKVSRSLQTHHGVRRQNSPSRRRSKRSR